MDDKISLTISEAAKAIGVSRSKIFLLLKSGDVRAVKLGRRTLIPIDNLKSFIASCAERNAA
jgi:excisionase family DNA binding protein